jgi:hypothetical protein
MAVRKRSTCSVAGGGSSARTPLAVEAEGTGALPGADGGGLAEGTGEEDEAGGVLPLAGLAAGVEGAGVSFEALSACSAAWTASPAARSAIKAAVKLQHGRAQVEPRNWGDFMENIRTSRCP